MAPLSRLLRPRHRNQQCKCALTRHRERACPSIPRACPLRGEVDEPPASPPRSDILWDPSQRSQMTCSLTCISAALPCYPAVGMTPLAGPRRPAPMMRPAPRMASQCRRTLWSLLLPSIERDRLDQPNPASLAFASTNQAFWERPSL